MNKGEERLSDEDVCLGVEVIGEDRVKVDEPEVAREQCPVAANLANLWEMVVVRIHRRQPSAGARL